jgi:type II secretory pathway pseudopilin PulG
MLLIAVAIVGILAGILAPVVANHLDDAQLRGEAASLASLRKDFEATYDATDFNALNESSLPSSGLPAGTTFTTFDDGSSINTRIFASSVTVDPASWVTRIAAHRGITSYTSGATYTQASQNQYSAIAFNPYGCQRCLVAGPSGELGQQRYLLISLMAPPYRGLAFPTADATQVFDSIWDQSWESIQALAPSAWASFLTVSQVELWNSTSTNNRTNASRVFVERILQPKYTLTLANNSPTDTAWVDIGPTVDAITAAANAGTVSSASVSGFTTGILAGRLIVVRRGPSVATAYEVQRFFLYSDVTLTVQ